MFVKNNFTKAYKALDTGMAEIVATATKDVYGEVRHQLDVKIYDTPESPTYKRTHNLYNSARYTLVKETGTIRVGGIHGVDYAVIVHEGTVNMPARPYFTTAIKVSKATLLKGKPVRLAPSIERLSK